MELSLVGKNCFLLFPVWMEIICRNQYSTREQNWAQELDGVTALYSRYELNTTKIPQKSVVLLKIYTPYAYLWGDGLTHGWTNARTDGRTENIYSIFRDKLLLLGEHVLNIFLIALYPPLLIGRYDYCTMPDEEYNLMIDRLRNRI